MYDVIKELKKVTMVEFYDENQENIKNIPFSNVTFNFIGGNGDVYDLNTFKPRGEYENLEVYSNELGKLIIFQDYGNDSKPPTGYEVLQYQLMLPDNDNSSLGYYNGKFVYILVSNNYMRIYDLFEYELPDLSTLFYKRPYTFNIITDGDNVYYHISLYLDNYFEHIYKTNKKLSDILTVKNVNELFNGNKNYVPHDDVVSNGKYITRDYLVKQGFSFNNEQWHKNGLYLEDYGEDAPFIVRYNGEYIFEIEELLVLLGQQQN